MRKLSPAQQELLADLAGQLELAAAMGVSRSLVSMWIKRHKDFPKPVAEVAATPLWRRSEVLEWHATRQALVSA